MTTNQHYLWYLADAKEWGKTYTGVYFGDGEVGLAGDGYSTGTDYLRKMFMAKYGDGHGIGMADGNARGDSGIYDY